MVQHSRNGFPNRDNQAPASRSDVFNIGCWHHNSSKSDGSDLNRRPLAPKASALPTELPSDSVPGGETDEVRKLPPSVPREVAPPSIYGQPSTMTGSWWPHLAILPNHYLRVSTGGSVVLTQQVRVARGWPFRAGARRLDGNDHVRDVGWIRETRRCIPCRDSVLSRFSLFLGASMGGQESCDQKRREEGLTTHGPCRFKFVVHYTEYSVNLRTCT